MEQADGSNEERQDRHTETSDASAWTPFGAENAAIAARRALYGIRGDPPPCGLALSGGGIRSATFSLGLLRGLGSRGLLQSIDFLSTVSGGGYAGTFYCGLFAARADHAPIADVTRDDLLSGDRVRKALHYLRQSGRYLTPAGFGDYVYAFALLCRNWLSLTLVTGMAIMFAVLLLDAARAFLIGHYSAYADFAWASPLVLLLIPCAISGMAAGWAYWLTMSDASARIPLPRIGNILIIASGIVALAASYAADSLPLPEAIVAFAAIAAPYLVPLALVAGIAHLGWSIRWSSSAHGQTGAPGHASQKAMAENIKRQEMTTWLSWSAQAFLAIATLAVCDTVAAVALLPDVEGIGRPTGFSAIVTLAVPAGRWLIKRLSPVQSLLSGAKASGTAFSPNAMLGRFGGLLAWIAAMAFAGAALVFWGTLAHVLAFGTSLDPEKSAADFPSPTYCWALLGIAIFVLFAWFTQSFANLSSLATFYAARLRRAYLGASNPARVGLAATGEHEAGEQEKHEGVRVDRNQDLDDLPLAAYFDAARTGAPVHIVNVTVNATRGQGPATIQRDRHGLNLAITPEGMMHSAPGAEHLHIHALGSEQETAPTPASPAAAALERPITITRQPAGQALPISTWVAISGAAFTTGLGSQTSLAKSILAFLANVRLGYWWKRDRSIHVGTGSYMYLFREMLASFHGTEKPMWYLSDGGHFENTAVYELVRREVPFIIASDNGCDPAYGFLDVANLVRKCRIDFEASIEFLDEEPLDALLTQPRLRKLFAAPHEFAEHTQARSAIAMLADIRYSSGRTGTLLVVKPRLTDTGPADLRRYLADNPEFPQQTTFDQFFDEAQWESYYELGRLIASRLFDRYETPHWQPAAMRPVNSWPA